MFYLKSMECKIKLMKKPILSFLIFLIGLLFGTHDLFCQDRGLYWEVYTGISGSSIFDLTNSLIYPDRPTRTSILTDFFQTPTNYDDNYGSRVRGFLTVPQSGKYIFWIASDDASTMYISDDNSVQNKKEIASVSGWTSYYEWDKEPTQQSSPIYLEVGKYYYVEVLMKEGTGGDHLEVRWQLPDGTIEEPIPAWRFIPVTVPISPPIIVEQPSDVVADEGKPAVFDVLVSNLDPVSYRWQRDGHDIPGATNRVYTNYYANVTDDGAKYSCIISNSLGQVVTRTATLRVVPDITPPFVLWAANSGANTVVVVFSEPIYGGANVNNYKLDNNASIISAKIDTDNPSRVVLTTSPLSMRVEYTLTINNITDRSSARNMILSDTRVRFMSSDFSGLDIGSSQVSGSILPVVGGYTISAAGKGIIGTNDQFYFAYQPRYGDFDICVRVPMFSAIDPWAEAGLMARETLTVNSKMAATVAMPGISGCAFKYRTNYNAQVLMTGNFPVNYPNTWIRLVRSGNIFSGYAGIDGTNWYFLGQQTIGMSNIIYVGFCAASKSSTNVATINFGFPANTSTNVNLVSGLPPGFEPLGPSSRRTGLVISEIMYHPKRRSDGRDIEYLEIFNSQPFSEDLSGYRISGAISYEFPQGTILRGGDFIVIAKSPHDIVDIYGITNVLGPYQGRLENSKGVVQLENRLGAILLSAHFSGDPPWSCAADGSGHSLVLGRPSYGESDVRAWKLSSQIGGSPGKPEPISIEPLNMICINEFLAEGVKGAQGFIELYNHSTNQVDISGCIITDDPDIPRYIIPNGTKLGGGGFYAVDRSKLGFDLRRDGQKLFLFAPQMSRVIDAIRFSPQRIGVSYGRYPNGNDAIVELSRPTQAAPNSFPLIHDVVINEIYYNPVSGDSNDEFIELFNKGTNWVDISGWRFTDGVSFEVPTGTRLAPGSFAVVTKNIERFRENYGEITNAIVLGNFSGSLANSGERIALSEPDFVIITNRDGSLITNRIWLTVDDVRYYDGGQWGEWADGGGSSLELKDPNSDNSLASNWADSDESGKAEWTIIENTGVLDLGYSGYGIGSIEILMLGPGECLVDDVEVVYNGVNIVQNPGFEGGLIGWTPRGSHKHSFVEMNGGINNSKCLHVVASSRGDTGPNQVYGLLNMQLSPGMLVTIRAKVKFIKGWPEILFRLHGNYLEATGRLKVPKNVGTPGRMNSCFSKNTGPAICQVSAFPVLPAAGENVRISALVTDPQGIKSVKLVWRYPPALNTFSAIMNDDGSDGDMVAGDGVFTAFIPGQPAGTMIAFYLEANDGAMSSVTNRYPNNAPEHECLVRFGETIPSGNLGTYRIWAKQETVDEWTSRERGSNEPLDVTFVYGNYRIIYNAGALYSGSPFHWGGYSSPVNDDCNYVVIMPKDDKFLGQDEFVLNAPSNLGSDTTALREQATHWAASRLGLPMTYRRYVNLFFNGVRKSFVFEDAQQPNADFLEQWFPKDPNGDLHKIEDWFEYNTNYNFINVDATLDQFLTSNGEKKLAIYRWMWRKRAVTDSANNYSNLFALVDAMNYPDTNKFYQIVSDLCDVEQWMRTMALRHVVGDWDSYGYKRGKNMFAYKPEQGKWQLLNWDISFAFGLGDGPSYDVFYNAHFDGTVDRQVDRLLRTPAFRRAYLRAIKDLLDGPFYSQNFDSWLDERYNALLANGIRVNSPQEIKSYMNARRTYLQKVLATNESDFRITFPESTNYISTSQILEIKGAAPLALRSLKINGIEYQVNWTSISNWSVRVPLNLKTNIIKIEGIDSYGEVITNIQKTINVQYAGPYIDPEQAIVINEIMYKPVEAGGEYIEIYNISSYQSFDLSGWYFNGIDFTFTNNTVIQPNGYLVVVENAKMFRQLYGQNIPIAGEFNGHLDNAGETISLIRPQRDSQPPVIVDMVTYGTKAPWSVSPIGGGSSLQLIDPTQDNNRPGNWVVVDENGFTPPRWQYFSATFKAISGGVLDIQLDREGAVFIDDIELVQGQVPSIGKNLVSNGSFESGIGSWTFGSAYQNSSIVSAPGVSGSNVLMLVKDNSVSSIGLNQSVSGITSGLEYTLSFWYLETTNSITLAVKFANATVSQNTGMQRLDKATPGRVNSAFGAMPPFPKIRINEVQPVNISTITNNHGFTSPWIELYNDGSDVINLSELYLSNDPLNPFKWAFPKGATLNPKSFILVWADARPEFTSTTEYHSNFELARPSGIVLLSRLQSGQAVVLDCLDYSALVDGTSYGLYPDNDTRGRQSFLIPTPGSYNKVSVALPKVFINEIMADNASVLADPADGDFEDWFELYNGGEYDVELGGYYLTDSRTNLTKFRIPNGTVIKSKGTMLVWADEETGQNGAGRDLHVNFKLSKSGEFIGLYSPDGIPVDTIEFGAQKTDVSIGRLPDGSTNLVVLPNPSPGQLNSSQMEVSAKIVKIGALGSNINLFISGSPGTQFRVKWTDNIESNIWYDMGTEYVVPDSGFVQIVDTNAILARARYYKLVNKWQK